MQFYVAAFITAYSRDFESFCVTGTYQFDYIKKNSDEIKLKRTEED